MQRGCRKHPSGVMQGGGPRFPPSTKRSPKKPSKERVRGLDSLLGLRHQLHGLPLLASVVHVARRRRRQHKQHRCSQALSTPRLASRGWGAGQARARGLSGVVVSVTVLVRTVTKISTTVPIRHRGRAGKSLAVFIARSPGLRG